MIPYDRIKPGYWYAVKGSLDNEHYEVVLVSKQYNPTDSDGPLEVETFGCDITLPITEYRFLGPVAALFYKKWEY